MNLILSRKERRPDGIFSELLDASGKLIAVTLEHAYIGQGPVPEPKVPNGTFECVRGMHRLHGMAANFETFEVTGVTGHEGILFHVGNYNADSEGCILLGDAVSPIPGMPEERMLVLSRPAFADFMELQKGVAKFLLTVAG